MIRILLSLISLFIAFQSIQTQEVISSTGHFTSENKGSFSSTVGEIVTESISDNQYIVTQGFQQPESTSQTSIKLLHFNGVKIYPNPVETQLKIILPDENIQGITYKLNNFKGEMVIAGNIVTNDTSLNIAKLPVGIYIFCLYQKNKLFWSQKIIIKTI